MKKKYLLVVFLLVCMVQLFAPFYKMSCTYFVLKQGDYFLFDIEPVDPYDAFRGRYVVISFKLNTLPYYQGFEQADGHHFVELHKGAKGEAIFGRVQSEAFKEHKNYIKLKGVREGADYFVVEYPINRFYMNEFEAPKADSLLQDSKLRVQAGVRVYDGDMAIEQLYVNGLSISEYLQGN